MTDTDRQALRDALLQLGGFVAQLAWPRQDATVRAALQRILFDSVAVIIAGARLDESARLRTAVLRTAGPSTVFGHPTGTDPTVAGWLNGVSMVCLELDEGNKRSRGHAAAHVLPAALALAEAEHSGGEVFAAALLAGHEVTSRFGAAVQLRAGVHPHGNWGVAGAAAAAARIMGLPPDRIAAAIDSAGALALTTPFDAALAGMNVRNAWIGHAASAGIYAAALSASSAEPVTGIAVETFGCGLGALTAGPLTERLGSEFAAAGGYFKRHASCSYTHPPADAILALLAEHGPIAADDIDRIRVDTHRLAAGLDGTSWPSRLAAMFSIPYVVAVALIAGACGPDQFGDAWRSSADVARLADKVQVVEDKQLTARLPAERVARLHITLASGAELRAEVTNPVGDADHDPFTDADLFDKAAALLGSNEQATTVRELCGDLLTTDDVTPVLAHLRALATTSTD